ncbi:Uncharacterized protein M6B38_221590 [Iris pallida]|uniref:BSD domain-containing protein n=1 Tax=Iris pallida TaxID=29817 RepID=A0AAX6DWH1_IRIPA|nr:Uncharacterized protein M6B38_221590 [Iris pallida]
MARGLRGVKDDLSEIGRHLLDIACFLSPLLATTYADSPPSSPHSLNPSSPESRAGDLPEAGGVFRSGMSRLSSVFRRPGVGKERDSDGRGGGGGGVGGGVGEVRGEVVGFVRDLVKCPESWVEFPVPVDDHFDMSLDQKEHIATVECLAPSLAALRISLCPSFMNDESFWKIYFALLHPKLNKHESELLSTQQARHLIVEEMRMNLKKKMQDRLNSSPQIPVAGSSSLITSNKASEIQEEDNDVRPPQQTTEAASLQYIDRWFERSIPGEMDASAYNRPQLSSKDDSEVDDDNVVLLKKYKSSSSFEAASLGNSPFSSYERLQLLDKTYSQDYHEKPHRRLQNRDGTDEETSSWHAVEDSSDFEIVDRS